MSIIVAVLRAYCRNQAASVTQFQAEAGSQVKSKDRVGAKTIMFFLHAHCLWGA